MVTHNMGHAYYRSKSQSGRRFKVKLDLLGQIRIFPPMTNPTPITPTVGQVLIDYSVRAETAAGALRNSLQILIAALNDLHGDAISPTELAKDVAAATRLVREALDKIEGGLR